MSAARPRRLVPYKDFTHYLCIPLATPSSRPQLRASFAQFERATSAIVPKGSVLNPDFAQLFLARLKMKSQKRIDAFSKHLHGLDVREMLRVAAVTATRGQPKFADLPYQDQVPPSLGMPTEVDLSPLKVDVSGIHSASPDPSQTTALYASAFDRTHRLQHFRDTLLKSLSRARFLPMELDGSCVNILMTILPTRWGEGGHWNPETRRWTNAGGAKTPRIDASDLIRGWTDFEWATNVQLEKLCVCPLGLTEKLPDGGSRQKQPKEVDSIVLP